MADLNVEPQTTETVTTQPNDPSQSNEQVVSPQAQSRQQIYEQYYASQQPPVAKAEPVVEESGNSGQGGSAHESSPNPTPEATPDPQAEQIRALQAQIAALEQKLNPTPSPTPAQPQQSVEKVPVAQRFLAKLKEGAPEDAVNELLAGMREELEQEKRVMVQEAQERAVQQIWFESEITKFINQVKAENADLVPLEELIAMKTQRYLDEVDQSTVKTNADKLRVYTEAVNKAVAITKTIVQQYRGAGHAQALTTKQQVLSAQPVTPNSVMNRPQAQPEQPTNDPHSYLAKRQAISLARRGITTQS